MTASAFWCLVLAAFWPTAVSAADGLSPITVVIMGDSLLTGHGLPTKSRFPALLELRLRQAGYDVTVVNPGFQYTSKVGVDWLEHPVTADGSVDLSSPNTFAIVELGSNDCPDGLALEQTRANLDKILRNLSAADVPVLLVGAAAFDFCGAGYVVAFEQVFSDLAGLHGALLYPDFSAGVFGHPDLLQDDKNHPNEVGEIVVLNNMLPLVEQLIARVKVQ